MLAYLPVLGGDFLWDDAFLVGINPFFKSPVFALEVFRHHLFLDSLSAYYRPVQNWSYMLDYLLWDRNPFGYHLSNVLYHALSAFLIWRLLLLLIPRLWEQLDESKRNAIALLTAFVWAVHPIHNAAVAYIAGRADSLACIFAISGWLLVERSRKLATKGCTFAQISCILGAILCGVLGLCSKEITIIWIALFLIFTFAFEKNRSWLDRFACLAGAIVALLICTGLRHLPPAQVTESVAKPDSNPPLLALGALGDYAGLIFFPANLHMDRTVCTNDKIGTTAAWLAQPHFRTLTFLGFGTLLAFVVCLLWKGEGRRLRIFAIVWFFVGFLPISNLYPLNAQVAEHWIYMPSVGFILLIAAVIAALPTRLNTACTAAMSVAIIPLAIRTSFRADDWSSPIKFYTRTIEQGGGTPRVHTNLAVAYFDQGNLPKAEEILVKTVKYFPEFVNARIALGAVYAREGKLQEATANLNLDKKQADDAAKRYPTTWRGSLNYAKVQVAQQDFAGALQTLNDAIVRSPGVWDLVDYKANVLQQTGRGDEALALVKAFCDATWWQFNAWLRLGELEIAKGDDASATAAFKHAAWLDIHAPEPYEGIAMLELKRNHPEHALEWQKKAVARANATPRQYLLLAKIYDLLKRPDDTRRTIEEMRALGDLKPEAKGSDLIF